MTQRAVVTGGGIVCSLGIGRGELYKALLRNQSGVRPASFDADGAAAPLTDFDPSLFLTRRQVKMLDRLSWGALMASHQALDEAGHPQALLPTERSGIAVATTYYTTGNLLQLYQDLASVGPQHINPLWLRNSNPSALMMLCAIQHKLKGVNLTIASGETAGIDALLHCLNALETGASSVMMLLGCESTWLEVHRYFDQRGILAPRADRSIPYGSGSAGAVLGECAAALVLETPEKAEARGATVLAEVVSVGSRVGDNRRALRCAIEQVLSESGTRPADIGFIIGAGNGDLGQDTLEAEVLTEVFGTQAPLLTSIKGSIGDCLSASGLANILVALEASREGRLPAIRALDEVIPQLSLPVVRGNPAIVDHGLALVCAIGHLGGAAVALLRV